MSSSLPSIEELGLGSVPTQKTQPSNNSVVSIDELPSVDELGLKKKESTVSGGTSTGQTQPISTSTEDDDGYLTKAVESIASGALNLYPSVAKFGSMIDDLTNEAGLATASFLKKIGVDEETADKTGKYLNYSKYFAAPMVLSAAKGYDVLNESGVLKPLEEKSQELSKQSKEGFEDTFTNYWEEGEYKKAMGVAGLDAMQSLPGTMIAAFGGPAGVTALGAGAAGEKYDNLKNSNIDANQYVIYTNALMTGMLEGLTEYLGTATYGRLLKSQFKTLGEKVARENLEKGVSTWLVNNFRRLGLYTAPLGEGIEEGVNQIGQNITDKITGVNTNIGITEGFWNASIPGIMGGHVFVAPGAAMDIVNSYAVSKSNKTYIKSVEEDLLQRRIGDLKEAPKETKEEVKTRPVEENLEPLEGKGVESIPVNKEQTLASQPMKLDEKVSVIIDKFTGVQDAKEAKNVIENLTPDEVKTLSIGLMPGEKTNKNKLAETVLSALQEKQNTESVQGNEAIEQSGMVDESGNISEQPQEQETPLNQIANEQTTENQETAQTGTTEETTVEAQQTGTAETGEQGVQEEQGQEIVPETHNIKQQEPAPILQEKLTESVNEFPVQKVGEKIKLALNKVYGKTFKIGGAMKKGIRQVWEGKRHKVNSLAKEVQINDMQWRKALKKEYKGTPSEAIRSDLNVALANLGKDSINAEEALKNVPKSLHEPLKKMRNNIDALTDELRSMGVNTDLDVTLDKNTGHYVTRAYKMHYDPNWKWEAIDTDVKTNAVNNELFRRNPELFQKVKEQNSELSQVFDANKNTINNEVVNSGKALRDKMLESNPDLNAIVESIKGEFKHFIDQNGEGGYKNAGRITKTEDGILKQRESIPPDIRAMMGEYNDPSINSVLTQLKQIELIEHYKFMDKLTSMYDGKYFSQTRTEEFSEPLMSDGKYSKWFTTPEIKESMNVSEFGMDVPWLKLVIQLNGLIKFGLVSFSQSTQIRNFTSAFQMQVMNGRMKYYLIVEGLNPMLGKKGKIGLNPIYPIPVINYFRFINNPKYLPKIKEYYEQGVLGESLHSEEIKKVYGIENYAEQITRNPNKLLDITKQASKGGKKAMAIASNLYEAMDNIHRIYAYEVEKYRYNKIFKKRHPAKIKEEIEQMAKDEAGKIVNDTYQTYSKLPPIVKWVRAFPFIGAFPGFSAEVIRTYYNTMALAAKELKSADSAFVGAERLAGLGIATGMYAALAGGSYMLVAGLAKAFSDDEEDEKKLSLEKEKYDISRRFVPTFLKPSDLIDLGVEDGKFKFIDVGNSSTLGYFNRVWRRAFNEEVGMDDATIISGIEEFLRPFIDEDVLAGKILDVMKNQNPMTGSNIYNPEDDQRAWVMTKYILDGVKPGEFRDIGNIVKSFAQDNTKGTKINTPAQTITSAFTGLKTRTIDLNKSWAYSMDDYSERIGDILSLYSKPLYNYNKKVDGGISEEDQVKLQNDLEETRIETEDKLNTIVKRLSKDYVDLQKTGVLEDNVNATLEQLKAGGYENDRLISAIKNGELLEIDTETGRILIK